MKLKIANIELDSNIILAPIAGYTDLAFRTLIREFGGCGLCVTELISCRSLCFQKDVKIKRLLMTDDFDNPLSWQIFGFDKEYLVKGAILLRERGAKIIDINMGCSVRKVLKRDAGSGLLKDIDKTASIVDAVVKALDIPVTVKMRLGWTKDESWLSNAAKKLENAGAQMITIHPRTPYQKFVGKSDWSRIKEVVDSVDIPVIGNGDIWDVDDAFEMMDMSGCAGIMIGRGTLKKPWLIRDIYHRMEGLPEIPEPDNDEKIKIMKRHIELLLATMSKHYAEINFRKWWGRYPKGNIDLALEIFENHKEI